MVLRGLRSREAHHTNETRYPHWLPISAGGAFEPYEIRISLDTKPIAVKAGPTGLDAQHCCTQKVMGRNRCPHTTLPAECRFQNGRILLWLDMSSTAQCAAKPEVCDGSECDEVQ